MTGKNIGKLAGYIALPLIIGGTSGFIIRDEIKGWYTTLAKPSFNPPNYLFGPVWTVLYILMGISLYMILNTPADKRRTTALVVFGIQLFLNFWWSIIFFSYHSPVFAMADIIALWLFIIWMIILFIRIKPVAGCLQIPYILWVTFASALNYGIMMLNLG